MNTDLTAQEANERMRKHQEEHNRDDVYIGMLAKCNAQIAELQAKLTAADAAIHFSTTAANDGLRLIEELEKKLAEAEKRSAQHFNEMCNVIYKNEALERELERLRSAVPKQLALQVDLFETDVIRFCHNLQCASETLDAKQKLLALIGSLIERKREDLEEAFRAGADWNTPLGSAGYHEPFKEDKDYAERKMKEGK